MHEIFSNLTQSGKRAFNKLSDQEKAEIIKANVDDKISNTLLKAITDAIIQGSEMAYETIYKEFVKPIDETDDEIRQHALMNSLCSQIRLKHLEYEKKRRIQETQNAAD